jgi:hypothetical protein
VIIFILAQTLNVILNTWKSIVTVKGSKVAAAAVNAITFGFYTWVLILIADASLGIVLKCIIVAACNFIGVYVVKLIEEKMRKDKVWKIEMTISSKDADAMHDALTSAAIPNHYLIAGKHAVFSCFCDTQKESAKTLAIGKTYNAKTFASETKII